MKIFKNVWRWFFTKPGLCSLFIVAAFVVDYTGNGSVFLVAVIGLAVGGYIGSYGLVNNPKPLVRFHR